jgi:hypothetical protein
MTTRKVRGDRLLLGTLSVLRTLIFELHKTGAIEIDSLIAAMDDSVSAHREHGDPNQIADAIAAAWCHSRCTHKRIGKRQSASFLISRCRTQDR